MKEQLIHILDQSVCLSRKQMKEYLSGTMLPEEMHAAEVHLSTCPLCSMAMEGFEEHGDEALAAIASLNSGFLKEHFDNIAPQIHLNSIAHAAAALPAAHPAHKRSNIQPLWRTASIAAAVLLAFGTLWYVEFGRRNDTATAPIAMAAQHAPATSEAARAGNDNAPGQIDAATHPATAITPVMKEVPGGKTAAATGKQENEKTVAAPLTSSDASGSFATSKPAGSAIQRPPATIAVQSEAAAPVIMTGQAEPATERKKQLSAQDGAMAYTPGRQYTKDDATIMNGNRAPTINVPAPAKAKPPAAAEPLGKAAADDRTPMDRGDDAYDKGRYSSALVHYQKQMASGSFKERNQATIRAARCYAALGNKAKAEELLQHVISDGDGPERRAARRTLRSLE